MADVRIEIKTIVDKAVADINKVATATKGLDDSAKNASGGGDKLTAGLGKLAGALSVSALVLKAAAAIKEFGTRSLETASRAQELTSKFDIVFGKSAPAATKILDDFGDAVKRSNLDLKEMAATTQNVAVGMGANRTEAADYSVELTKLAVDVAAFNNAQDLDVSEAFNSALTGNGIAAKRYGVIINDASMSAELLKMGIEGGTQAATEAEKVHARYNIIMGATKDAQGAAAREADSYTNVTKGLEAAMTDLEVAVGKNLIPTMTKLKIAQTEAINGLTENINKEMLLQEALEIGAITKEYYRDATHRASMADETSSEVLQELIYKYREENGLLSESTQYTEDLTAAQANYSTALDEVSAAQKNLEDIQLGWLQSTANEVSSALKGLGLDTADYIAALGTVDEVMGTSEQAEALHKQAVDDIVAAYGETGNMEEFQAALQGLKDAELPQTTDALEAARAKADELYTVLEKLENLDKITVEVEYVQTGNTDANFASGVTNFKVPPGYPNDSFTAGLTSGEVVTVKQGGSGDVSNSNAISVYGDLVVNGSGGMASMDVLSEVRI